MKRMNEINQVQDDEIDLFEFFKTLWDGKWLISAFVAIAVLLGGSFVLLKDAVYESKLIYSVDAFPPYYDKNMVLNDFQNKFYSVSVFEEWKQNNSNTSLVFEKFSKTEVVDGFVLSKGESQRLATLVLKEKGESFVLVKSNQLPILDDFFKYANYINELLKNDYVVRSNEELDFFKSLRKDSLYRNNYIVQNIFSIKKYIFAADKGANILAIQRPTMPKTIQQRQSKHFLILAVSIFLGGIVGVVYVLISNAIRKRKESSAKS